MKANPSLQIDINVIPEWVRYTLLEAAYEATKEYFAQPGTEEKYQEWLARRNSGKEL